MTEHEGALRPAMTSFAQAAATGSSTLCAPPDSSSSDGADLAQAIPYTW